MGLCDPDEEPALGRIEGGLASRLLCCDARPAKTLTVGRIQRPHTYRVHVQVGGCSSPRQARHASFRTARASSTPYKARNADVLMRVMPLYARMCMHVASMRGRKRPLQCSFRIDSETARRHSCELPMRKSERRPLLLDGPLSSHGAGATRTGSRHTRTPMLLNSLASGKCAVTQQHADKIWCEEK